MKKKEKYKIIYNKTEEEVIDLLNKKAQIYVGDSNSLVDRVSKRYPDLDKKEIMFIIKTIFIVMRECIIRSCSITFNGLFKDLTFNPILLNREKKLFQFRGATKMSYALKRKYNEKYPSKPKE
jgi:hypothetical protein